MINLSLKRFSYSSTETEGTLQVGDVHFATIERPWIPHIYPGGKPFESCIPDGTYLIAPWTRPNGDQCVILTNSQLGVYGDSLPQDQQGRYLCLIHKANFVRNVVGCIALGTTRSLLYDKKIGGYQRAVSASGEAMRHFLSLLNENEAYALNISPAIGTVEV